MANRRTRPKYLELADALEEQCAIGPPGSPLPGEHTLAADFGVHRLTAREAVRELERRLLVRRIPGRGTFIAHRLTYTIDSQTAPSFRQLISALGHTPGVSSTSMLWSGRGSSRHLIVERTLTVDDLVASATTDRFPHSIGSVVADSLSSGGSVAEALSTCGYLPRRGAANVSFRVPPADVECRLGYSGSAFPIWYVESYTVNGHDGSHIHRSESWMRPEMFSVHVIL